MTMVTKSSNEVISGFKSNIILPPPEIRTIIDKTAQFVARNGPEFEYRILENERTNVKFSFLNLTDPYRPYYDKKVEEIRNKDIHSYQSLETELEAEDIESKEEIQITTQLPLEPPYTFLFYYPEDTLVLPVLDMDIIHLTAMFTARNGKHFLSALSERECRNPQFDFLKSSHHLHGYFSKLITQYSHIMNIPSSYIERLTTYAHDKQTILQTALQRSAYLFNMKQKEKEEKQSIEKEKKLFQSIDWQDFTIVETIHFSTDDNTLDLPPPLDMDSLRLVIAPSIIPIDKPISQEQGEEEMEIDEPSITEQVIIPQEEMKYIPKALSELQEKLSHETLQICPICQQKIPLSRMDEHIRLELLDPKWTEQKKIYQEKIKDSNIIDSGIDVGKHLSQLAKKRSDIFTSDEQPKKMAAHPTLPITQPTNIYHIFIQIPYEQEQTWKLDGQTLDIVIRDDELSVMTIHALKERICELTRIPGSRQKLVISSTGIILKNTLTIIESGIHSKDNNTLILSLKERGGRK